MCFKFLAGTLVSLKLFQGQSILKSLGVLSWRFVHRWNATTIMLRNSRSFVRSDHPDECMSEDSIKVLISSLERKIPDLCKQ